MKLGLLLGLLAFALWGCSSLPPMPLPSDRAPLGPLLAQAMPEVYGLRVDVDRIPLGQDSLANDLKSSVSSAPSIDPSQYSWVGVEMGNGLFVDSNGNLAVDLASLYHLSNQFQILETVNAIVPYQVKFERSGDIFKRSGGGSDLPDVHAEFNMGEIDLNFFNASTQPSIFIDNGVTYDGHGLMNAGQFKLKQVSEYHVSVPAFLGSVDYYVKRPDLGDYGSRFIVRRIGNELVIRHPGMVSDSSPSVNYVLTPEGCAFTDMSGRLHIIQKTGNLITVTINGKMDRTFKVIGGGQL
jgi:hypothetical protein